MIENQEKTYYSNTLLSPMHPRMGITYNSKDDTIMLPRDFISLHHCKMGVEQIIYTDTYDNAQGAIEVIDDVYPEFEPSQVCENFFNDGFTLFLQHSMDQETSKSKSVHTIAMYFDNFTGTVEIQDDLSDQPSSSHSDGLLSPELFSNPTITINNETGVQAFVLKANVNWIR